MTRPFEGVRILDFTQVFAGPLASFQLSVLGADVIKVERPGGEDMRGRAHQPDQPGPGVAAGWAAINANKRCICLDLKHASTKKIVQALVRDVDVVMENFRPGVMDRLGIGYADLAKINPALIYCCVSGFGREGPLKDQPSYDGKIQAMSGIMSVTGHAESGPVRAGFAVCDATAGITAAFAVSSALFQRTHTGKGQLVDVSMYDSALTVQAPAVANYTIHAAVPGPSGNRAISGLPTADLYPVKDGHILLAANNEKQYVALMHAIGCEDVLADPRFIDWPTRIANEQALIQIINDALIKEDLLTWLARLLEYDVPCAQIQTLGEAIEHPQLQSRDYLQTLDDPSGPVTLGTTGFKLEHGNAAFDRGIAEIGEHTDAVLTEAGFNQDEIAGFRESGVF